MTSASTRAYEIIKSAIIAGTFAPGDRLVEAELTTLCQVSRTPVREALRRLASEGFAVFSPNQGAHVAEMGSAELEDLYELRALIEGYAAARAATRLSEEQIEEMEALALQIEASIEEAGAIASTVAPANSRFHRIILEAAESPRLLTLASVVVEAPLALRTIERYSPEQRARSVQHHRELIAAFRARDPQWARSVMTSHIKAAFAAIKR